MSVAQRPPSDRGATVEPLQSRNVYYMQRTMQGILSWLGWVYVWLADAILAQNDIHLIIPPRHTSYGRGAFGVQFVERSCSSK